MEYYYQSSKPFDSFKAVDCPTANLTLLTIYKEQLRTQGGKELNLSNYHYELDPNFKKLESLKDNYKRGQWVNLNLNLFLIVSEEETALIEFDDRLELLEYLDSRWFINDYLFLDLKNQVIDKHVLRHMIWELDFKLQEKISQRVEEVMDGNQVYEDDCYDYYESIREACRV
jgi:hypothetical protein